MEYITVEEMRALEANAGYCGVGEAELMENAGKAVADVIVARYSPRRTLVVCGRGNNGGDGFVAARYLELGGHKAVVLLLGRSADVKQGPAKDNLEKLFDLGVDVVEAATPEALHPEAFQKFQLIVDAVLGTGSRGVPRGIEREAIEIINASGKPVVSVDVPSGLDPRTGRCEVCVRPELVVTFHAPKKGLEPFRCEVAGIGIPDRASAYAGPGDLAGIRTRGDCAHKGACGRVLVVGGGPYTGAPALVALAALRAGAGWATVAAPRRAADIVAGFSPDLITAPLTDEHKIVERDVEVVAPLVARHDVVVIGNGAGRDPETLAALARIIGLCDRAVIDADALQPDMPLKGIVTPHCGELKRISGIDCAAGDPAPAVREFSAARHVVTLLKARPNVVTDGERLKLNDTGNPGMAVGGTGDVLAGIAGAFYTRNDAFAAAVAAAFVGGAAGDRAFEDKGYWLTATDVIGCIPYVMKKFRLKLAQGPERPHTTDDGPGH
ncbi:MAG TPA: NAD(P)H-hydrate dehydratase [Methanocella sp.]|nr:NAD(P)H-hydrate dehydratase [Methanocella sp.]